MAKKIYTSTNEIQRKIVVIFIAKGNFQQSITSISLQTKELSAKATIAIYFMVFILPLAVFPKAVRQIMFVAE